MHISQTNKREINKQTNNEINGIAAAMESEWESKWINV